MAAVMVLTTTIIGMYGSPQNCKQKIEDGSLVCANVLGLWWSQ
jgi:hypothetical protein